MLFFLSLKYLLKAFRKMERYFLVIERVFTCVATSEASFQKHLLIGIKQVSPSAISLLVPYALAYTHP